MTEFVLCSSPSRKIYYWNKQTAAQYVDKEKVLSYRHCLLIYLHCVSRVVAVANLNCWFSLRRLTSGLLLSWRTLFVLRSLNYLFYNARDSPAVQSTFANLWVQILRRQTYSYSSIVLVSKLRSTSSSSWRPFPSQDEKESVDSNRRKNVYTRMSTSKRPKKVYK